MKTLCIIPSKGRPEELAKYTLEWIVDSGVAYVVVVEPKEAKLYEPLGCPLMVLPKNDRGLGYSLGHAREFAFERGYEAIWKIDDDIKKFRKRYQHVHKDPLKAHEQRVETFLELYRLVGHIMYTKPRVGAIGFPYDGQMFGDRPYELNKKLQTSYVIRTKLYNPRPDISTQEDYHTSIQVLKAGYKLIRLSHYGIALGIEVGKGAGGLQSFDRKKLAEAEMKLLKKEYPGLAFKYKSGTNWGYEVDFKRSRM